jgi:phytoene desaturase
MPDIIDDAFAAVGESISDRLEVVPVEPAYRASFADGTNLDVHSDRDEMAAEIERFAGRRQAEGYLRLRSWLTRLTRSSSTASSPRTSIPRCRW